MPGELTPLSGSSSLTPAGRRLPGRTVRGLANIEHQTTLRLATVQAEGLVAEEKLHEIDQLSREAMTGQALLAKWRETLSAGDPFVAIELQAFSDFARLAKSEVLADALNTFCREGRR